MTISIFDTNFEYDMNHTLMQIGHPSHFSKVILLDFSYTIDDKS